MHESAADLAELQDLLDRSAAGAGTHLSRVITPERRLDAAGVCDALVGTPLIALATVTADGRPLVSPVDGIFYRGAFHFGSYPDSVRVRHIGARPHVSATHVPREELSITVHGRAELLDLDATENAGFRQYLLDLYLPRYGADWADMLTGGAVYARIAADRMFTFCFTPADTDA